MLTFSNRILVSISTWQLHPCFIYVYLHKIWLFIILHRTIKIDWFLLQEPAEQPLMYVTWDFCCANMCIRLVQSNSNLFNCWSHIQRYTRHQSMAIPISYRGHIQSTYLQYNTSSNYKMCLSFSYLGEIQVSTGLLPRYDVNSNNTLYVIQSSKTIPNRTLAKVKLTPPAYNHTTVLLVSSLNFGLLTQVAGVNLW